MLSTFLVNGGTVPSQFENKHSPYPKIVQKTTNCEATIDKSTAVNDENKKCALSVKASGLKDLNDGSQSDIDFDEKPLVRNTKTFEEMLAEKLSLTKETHTENKSSANSGLLFFLNFLIINLIILLYYLIIKIFRNFYFIA